MNTVHMSEQTGKDMLCVDLRIKKILKKVAAAVRYVYIFTSQARMPSTHYVDRLRLSKEPQRKVTITKIFPLHLTPIACFGYTI